MVKEKYIPSEVLVRKAISLTENFLREVQPKLETLLGKKLNKLKPLNQEDFKICQEAIGELLYSSVQAMSYINLATRDNGLKAQSPDNRKISIISESRERFNLGIEELLKECIPIKNPEGFLKELNQEFYDYISKTVGYSTRLGKFYIEDGRVYFKAKKDLPLPVKRGDSVVVGGIGFEEIKNAN